MARSADIRQTGASRAGLRQGGAGGSGRESEHGKTADPKPKPKTPDIDLGK